MTNQGRGGPPLFSPEYSLAPTSFLELSEEGFSGEDPNIQGWSEDCYFARQASIPTSGERWSEFLGPPLPQVPADDPPVGSPGEAISNSSLLTTPLDGSSATFTRQAKSYDCIAAAAIGPISAPSATSVIPLPKKRYMAISRPRGNRCPCPIFEAEVERELPHTCNGGGGNNMSELRTHMTRGGKGRPPHLSFLKLCKVCNNDFIDEAVFHEKHGQNCHFPHPQRKGDAADEYYQAFKAMVLTYVDKRTKTSTQDYIRSDGNGTQDHDDILRPREPSDGVYHDELRTLLRLDMNDHTIRRSETPQPGNSATPKKHVSEQETLHQPAFQAEQYADFPPWFRLDDGMGSPEKWEDTLGDQQMPGPWSPFDLRMKQGLELQMQFTLPGPSRSICNYHPSCSSFPMSSETQTTLVSDDASQLRPHLSDSAMSLRPQLSSSYSTQLSTHRDDSVGSSEVLFCPMEGCRKEFWGKCRRGTRSRHIRLKHKDGQEEKAYPCEVPRCSKIYCRQDARLKHYRKRHSDVMDVAAAKPRK